MELWSNRMTEVSRTKIFLGVAEALVVVFRGVAALVFGVVLGFSSGFEAVWVLLRGIFLVFVLL
jgi:hypothetical protein